MISGMLLTQILGAQPLPWYVAGALIALVLVGLLFLGRTLGISSNMRTMCTIGGAGRWFDFFNFDWKRESWNLVFLAGAMLAGLLTALNQGLDPVPEVISPATRQALENLGFSLDHRSLLPPEWFNLEGDHNGPRILILLVGGLLIGFGTRWAGGCTSGHAISGLSNLQLPSLIAVVGFFAGGLAMTHLLLPLIVRLL